MMLKKDEIHEIFLDIYNVFIYLFLIQRKFRDGYNVVLVCNTCFIYIYIL